MNRKIPQILSVEEVTRLIQAAGSLKYQAALSVAYGAGLRASEITHLKITDVDSKRMILRVEKGKGGRDRHAMLSPELLKILRSWYRDGQSNHKMLPGGAVQQVFAEIDREAYLSGRYLEHLQWRADDFGSDTVTPHRE